MLVMLLFAIAIEALITLITMNCQQHLKVLYWGCESFGVRLLVIVAATAASSLAA